MMKMLRLICFCALLFSSAIPLSAGCVDKSDHCKGRELACTMIELIGLHALENARHNQKEALLPRLTKASIILNNICNHLKRYSESDTRFTGINESVAIFKQGIDLHITAIKEAIKENHALSQFYMTQSETNTSTAKNNILLSLEALLVVTIEDLDETDREIIIAQLSDLIATDTSKQIDKTKKSWQSRMLELMLECAKGDNRLIKLLKSSEDTKLK